MRWSNKLPHMVQTMFSFKLVVFFNKRSDLTYNLNVASREVIDSYYMLILIYLKTINAHPIK